MIFVLGFVLLLVFLFGWSFHGFSKLLYFLSVVFVGGCGAHVATAFNIGVDSMEYEEGVSIRQESNTDRPTRFFSSVGRGHLGGGISGGK